MIYGEALNDFFLKSRKKKVIVDPFDFLLFLLQSARQALDAAGELFAMT